MALNKRAVLGLALMALCVAAVSAEKLKYSILVSTLGGVPGLELRGLLLPIAM